MVAMTDAATDPGVIGPEVGGGRAAQARRFRWMPVPVTVGYVAILLALGTTLSNQSELRQSTILLRLSTNLHNLLHGHIGTLLGSAFVTGDSSALGIVPLLACLLALAEMRFGSLRMLATFLAGHVGATLIVAAGLFIAVQAEWMSASVALAQDVGVSYGAMALIGTFAVVLPPAWRLPWAQWWLALGIVGVILGQTFTNVGHLIALVIGLLLAYLTANTALLGGQLGQAQTRRLSRLERGLLLVGTAIGICFLIA